VAVVALAGLLLPAAARADELLVMPFTCSVVGGQPVLTPGPETGHRILGKRDQRKHQACSPVNSEMCRQWTVHRFDLDCDGARVAWVSVVAATNEGSRSAWLLDGRLVLRMGPRWSLAPDDPCAREPGADEGYGYRRMKRYCSDRLAMAPPPVVELPFGYAPMLGIDGIFVKAAPGTAGGPAPLPPLPPLAAGPPPPKSAIGTSPQGTPAPDVFQPPPAPQREPAAKETTPPKAVSPPAPQVATQPPPAPPGAAPNAAEAPKAAPPEAKPAAPPPPKPAQRPADPAAKVAEAAPGPPPAAPMPAPPQEPAQPVAPSQQPDASPDGGAVGVSLFGLFRTTTIGAIVAFGGLALGLLTAFALARRREHAQDAARRRPRDLAAVSLDGRRPRSPRSTMAPVGNARGRLPAHAAAPAASRAPAPRAGASMAAGTTMVDLGKRMPCTCAEALQVLGMGVAPSGTEGATHAALKKIVDGLRQSWHPDHARDDADRALRELRSKQINAAWDLLQTHRAEV
jgi:hypothetical protein